MLHDGAPSNSQWPDILRQPEWRTQQPDRQHHYSPDQRQHAMYSDSDDTEWQQD